MTAWGLEVVELGKQGWVARESNPEPTD
jgi:hypothetical protein